MLPPFLRDFFWIFNRIFMVPIFRLGIGTIFGNPFWGYMMVLKTTGRKSGKMRYFPVNYAILNGSVYCLAGWGHNCDWYHNLAASPQIEMLLPGRALAGVAEEVLDPVEKITALRKVLIAGGFAGLMFGVNPHTVSDEELVGLSQELPLMRIKPYGIGSGAGDAGGWLWILVTLIFLMIHFQ